MVSVTGAAAIILAAASYGLLTSTAGIVLGLALHMAWHIFDGADGDLARITGRSSPRGELIDGVCDYAGHVVLYLTFGSIAASQVGGIGWILMWVAGVSRIVQAAHYEGTRRQYQLVVYATPWMGSEAPSDTAARRHPFVAYYLWLTGLIVPLGAAINAAAQNPATRAQLKEAVELRREALLSKLGPLSANYRTLAVGAAMMAGRPHWYFLFEIFVLGCVLLASLGQVRRVFAAALAQAEISKALR
ncbi:CDP-alcohol phosphatidyltransferase family protein [Kamptonema cortianum]|nr:CDP-alcohol phosphatidyltransferase family protein [Kamptonema cortianum]